MAVGKTWETGFRQFLVLLYKQLLLKKSHCFFTAFEILFPIIIASIPCMLYSSFPDSDQEHREGFKWVDFSTYSPIDPLTEYSYTRSDDLEFVYAPSNQITDQFMREAIRTFFGKQYTDKVPVPKSSEKELKNYILDERKRDEGKVFIGTVFKGFDGALPPDLDYKIYYMKKINTDNRYILNGPETYNEYRYSFFLQWQTSVGDTFIRKKAAALDKSVDYKIFLQMFPYPRYKSNPFNFYNSDELQTFIHLGLVVFIAALVKSIVEEKSDGSKTHLGTMGMTRSSYWASTFVNHFTSALIVSLVVTIVYKASNRDSLFHLKTDFGILLITLLLFMANLILFCMAFSIFFNRVVYAVLTLLGVYLLSFPLLIFNSFFRNSLDDYFAMSLFHKLCTCLYPSGGLLTLFKMIQLFEAGNEGVQWRNLVEHPTVPDINMLMVWAMMVFSIFFYIVVIWYMDTVWPFQPGTHKSCYFFIAKSYWFGEKPVVPGEIELVRNVSTHDLFEEEPNNALRSVIIKDLSKVSNRGNSSKDVEILHDVSLNCYRGQITVLLGHSEAGKSSIINMIAGKELPAKGFVSVTGTDQSIGLCPQHNTLHDELTVEQHLKIYAGVKGTTLRLLSHEAEQVLNSLKLLNRKYETASNLSYSEKRKLSIAMAIVGGSSVLLFDEPTHGMDAESKEHVWDALFAVRNNRTLIVSTQSFEEADTLGDRIAVMVGGEIHCCGSPAFLKQKLGSGTHLLVQKGVNSDSHGIASLVKMHVSTVTCEKESNKEVSFNLGDVTELGDLFEELEKSKSKLGIVSYGVSSSTLRDVLLTVSNNFYQKQNLLSENTKTETEDGGNDSLHPPVQPTLGRQFLALIWKQANSSRRRWRYHAVQLSIPFILMFVCCYFIKITSKPPFQPLKLDISNVYGSTDGFYYNKDTSLSGVVDSFKSVLEWNKISSTETSEPTHYVLDYGKKDLASYIKRLVVGGAFSELPNGSMNLTAWHNSATFHSMPMSLLLMQTALLRYVAKAGEMSLTIVPVLSASEKFQRVDMEDMGAAVWTSYFLPLAFTFLSLSFILPSTRERATRAKLVQLMSGAPAALYWSATFLWDYSIHFIICLFMILPPLIFLPSMFVGAHSKAIGSFLLFFLLYGWASLPFGYIVSFFVRQENRGLSIFIIVWILFSVVYVGLLTPMVPLLFYQSREALNRLNDASWFFYLFPPESVSAGASVTFQLAIHNAGCDMFTPKDLEQCHVASQTTTPTLLRCCKDVCEPNRCHRTMEYLSWTNKNFLSNGPPALYLGLEGIVFFAILFLLETRAAARFLDNLQLHSRRLSNQLTRLVLRKGVRHQVLRENVAEDPQVLQEEERIRNSASGGEALVALELAKRGENPSTANRLSFAVNGADHFGMIGASGAGKTSTFRMLTGDGVPSEGNAFIQGCSLRGEFRKFQARLGYCPETVPFIDGLTGREMLLLFGQLRGLNGRDLYYRVDQLIQSMEMTQCANEMPEFYSGGDKRKLSVALAFIGSPSVILLDEPTEGANLQSRQQIWEGVIRARKRTGSAVLLATQSIEEAEVLCNRLAVMVEGRFRCLGSTEQLRSKYGPGYVLNLKLSRELNAEKVNSLKEYVQGSLENVALKVDYQGKLQYHVINPSMTIGHLFKCVMDMKSKFELEDYWIGAISLEQTFLQNSRA